MFWGVVFLFLRERVGERRKIGYCCGRDYHFKRSIFHEDTVYISTLNVSCPK